MGKKYGVGYPEVGGQAALGRQRAMTPPWLTERHGYDPTYVELIASENFVSNEVLKATGSILTNKYGEG